MMPENYLPSRPVDPSTYLNPAMNPAVGGGASVQGPVNQAASLTPEQLQQLQMQQAQMQQQAPLQQAQVQQWQAQQGGGAPVAQTPTPEQRHAMQNAESYAQQRFMQATHPPLTPEQQKARQEQADIINNATLGTLGAATLGVGTALHETFGPSSSDLSKPHVSNVDKAKYDVMLEPVENGPVGQTKRWFGWGASEPDLRVKHLTPDGQPGVSINYNRNGQLQSLVQELETPGVKAHYMLDPADGQWTLSHVTRHRGLGRGEQKYWADELQQLVNSTPTSSPQPTRSWWRLGRTASPTPNIEQLQKLTELGFDKKSIETLLKDKIPLPNLEEVVKNAQIPHNWAEVFQKVVTKGGLFAALGALALGGGTWAFQHFTKKSPAQERLEAEIASNQARLAKPGQPPPQPAQAMNPAMNAQNGMPGMNGMYPQW
jgi:hypothetical protein